MTDSPDRTSAIAAAYATPAGHHDPLTPGTPVLAWPGSRESSPLVTRTRSEVWALPSGDRVVMVEGYAGGIALTHVDALPAARRPAPDAGLRERVAYLLWQVDQGYLTAEDRAIGENWMGHSDDRLAPDDLAARPHWLALADEVIAALDAAPGRRHGSGCGSVTRDPITAAADVLAAHRLTVGRCTCGWRMPANVPMLPAHEAHVAQALHDAGLLADADAGVTAAVLALREAADAIRDREGDALMRELLKLNVNETARVCADWAESVVRDRADEIESTAAAEVEGGGGTHG